MTNEAPTADGTLHVVGARCTHLGCVVGWNEAERSWDCPCHGSRFDARDGAVLNGPAARGLTPLREDLHAVPGTQPRPRPPAAM